MKIRSLHIAAAAATAGLLALSTPALAGDPDEKSYTIRYGDLDLSTAGGATSLESRIRGAARILCGTVPSGNIQMITRVKACHQEVIAEAQPRMEQAIAAALRGEERLALRIR